MGPSQKSLPVAPQMWRLQMGIAVAISKRGTIRSDQIHRNKHVKLPQGIPTRYINEL